MATSAKYRSKYTGFYWQKWLLHMIKKFDRNKKQQTSITFVLLEYFIISRNSSKS